MPRAGWVKPEADHRLSDHLAFAMLTHVYPPEVIDEVIAQVGRTQRRTRMLPSRIVVYYVLGLALFSDSSYDEVIRLLIAGQSWSSGWSQSWDVPTKAALYKARLRLSYEPLQELFERMAQPMASPSGGKGFYRGRRVLGIDGVSLDVPATAANEAEFDLPAVTEEVAAGFRRVRVLGVTELATGAIVGASIGRGHGDDAELAAGLLSKLAPGQLILGSSELYSAELWESAVGTGAELLWEVPADAVFGAGRRLDVRVLDDVLGAGAGASGGGRRFVTTLTDFEEAPASELAALFTERRSLATAFDEFRAHRNSPRVVLRSKVPAGVRQEIYGYLCVHYAMRWMMNAPDTHTGDVRAAGD